jgi:hypothetical protein
MSKMCMVAVGVLVCVAGVSFAMEPGAVYQMGGMPDPYAGPTPSGMRFGDLGQVMSVQTGDVEGGYVGGPGCPGCGFGVPGTPCDPCWRGPCIDWKLVGWYSNWRDQNHGCGCRGGGCKSCCY